MIIAPINSSISYSNDSLSVSAKHLFSCSGLREVTASIIANPEVLFHHLLVSTNPVHKTGSKESALGNMPHSERSNTNSVHARHLLPLLFLPQSSARASQTFQYKEDKKQESKVWEKERLSLTTFLVLTFIMKGGKKV